MKSISIIFLLIISAPLFAAFYKADFENKSKSGWYACGGKLEVTKQITASSSSIYALQGRSTDKQLVISSPKNINVAIKPDNKLEFDWRLDNREEVKYIAFGIKQISLKVICG